jgi:ATP-dependent Lhr-like helicase
VLAQQIVAEVASREWREDALFDLIRGARRTPAWNASATTPCCACWPKATPPQRRARRLPAPRRRHRHAARPARRQADRRHFSAARFPTTPTTPCCSNRRPERSAPCNEDFAVESLAGDVFQLGNTSYRIMRVEAGKVRVEDARRRAEYPLLAGRGAGAQRRTVAGVARLRARSTSLLARGRPGGAAIDHAIDWLKSTWAWDDAARQIVDYLARARAALGALPTQDTLVMERFFDESGGMQLVMHTPFGSRINRAWGLALRKRFCRTFNFELQAAATEDAIMLSLSTSHSFPLDEVWRYLRSASAEHILMQALLDAPLFNVRWRWNADHRAGPAALYWRAQGRATAAAHEERRPAGRGLPRPGGLPGKHRRRTRDCRAIRWLTRPWTTACTRRWTAKAGWPCCAGWNAAKCGCCRATCPRPRRWPHEILNARPYAFLDDAPLEERRTQAVINRRWTDPHPPTTSARSMPTPSTRWRRSLAARRATAMKCTRR